MYICALIIPVDFIYALGAALMVCLLSLVGFIYLFFTKPWIAQFLPYVVALATGVLLGNAFFHLIPESLEQGPPSQLIWGSIFAGIVTFGLIDRVLSHRHSQLKPNMKPIKSIGPLNLIGDGFHNFIDGLVIGGSFMVRTLS